MGFDWNVPARIFLLTLQCVEHMVVTRGLFQLLETDRDNISQIQRLKVNYKQMKVLTERLFCTTLKSKDKKEENVGGWIWRRGVLDTFIL